jgi:hypothetical protein
MKLPQPMIALPMPSSMKPSSKTLATTTQIYSQLYPDHPEASDAPPQVK